MIGDPSISLSLDVILHTTFDGTLVKVKPPMEVIWIVLGTSDEQDDIETIDFQLRKRHFEIGME